MSTNVQNKTSEYIERLNKSSLCDEGIHPIFTWKSLIISDYSHSQRIRLLNYLPTKLCESVQTIRTGDGRCGNGEMETYEIHIDFYPKTFGFCNDHDYKCNKYIVQHEMMARGFLKPIITT